MAVRTELTLFLAAAGVAAALIGRIAAAPESAGCLEAFAIAVRSLTGF